MFYNKYSPFYCDYFSERDILKNTFAALSILRQHEPFKTSADVGVSGADTLVFTTVVHCLAQIQTYEFNKDEYAVDSLFI